MELYDVGTSDLRDLWENPLLLESGLGHDTLMVCSGGRDVDDWSIIDLPSSLRGLVGKPSSCSGVVLRDRLMTDAALGGPKPIKAEHSYSLLACSPPPRARSPSPSPECDSTSVNNAAVSVASSNNNSSRGCVNARMQQQLKQQHQQSRSHSNHHSHHRRHQSVCGDGVFVDSPMGCTSESSRLDVTDMEEECFPAISMNRASGRDSARSSPEPFDRRPATASVATAASPATTTPAIEDRDEDEENDRHHHHHHHHQHQDESMLLNDVECPIIKGEPLSAPGSPCNAAGTTTTTTDPSMFLDDKSTIAISPHSLHITRLATSQMSDSEEDEDDEDEEMIMLPQQQFKVETVDIPCDDETIEQPTSQELPPTPPSSASSDSESTVSASCSPERRDSHGSVNVHQSLRGFLQPRLYVTTSGAIGQHATTRQPIHTPLISCQPKGSTGVLVLTEEEKRTLIAEGYPVPTKLPLTKQEEKSLKKVRRKIKNKISAQESRRKKKEYMDGLERRVTILTNENSTYRDKLNNLESTNRQLMKELQRLQAIVNRNKSS